METFHLSWRRDRRRAEVTLRPGRISVVVDRLQMVDADGEGRLLRAVFGPSTWRRSYAHRFVEIVSEAVSGERFHVPRVPDPAEGSALLERVRALAEEVLEAARLPAPRAAEAMSLVRAWDEPRLASDGERFRAIYPFLGPLPPDQQTAMVLRAGAEFEAHVAAVLTFLGQARDMRHGIYLDGVADASALASAMEGVKAVARRDEPVSAALERAEDAAAAAVHPLARVYVPFEPPAIEALAALHAASIGVSLVTAAPWTAAEADGLATRVAPLDLRGADTLYLLEPRPYPVAQQDRLALRAAFHRFRAQVRFADPPSGPVITHYPILQSIY